MLKLIKIIFYFFVFVFSLISVSAIVIPSCDYNSRATGFHMFNVCEVFATTQTIDRKTESERFRRGTRSANSTVLAYDKG